MKLLITSLIAFVFYSNAFAQCLQADYSFNGNANDGSGNNLHCITQNGVALTSNRFNNTNSAYQFDGIDDRIEFPVDFDFPIRTWSMWFYADTITAVPSVIMDNDHINIQFGQTEIVLGEIQGVKNLNFLLGANAFTTQINEKQWYHIALVREPTGSSFYLDGCLVFAGTDTSNDHSIDGFFTPALGTGRLQNQFFYKGKLDDIKVYNCALTQNDISVLADSMCFSVALHENLNKEEFLVYPNPTLGNVIVNVKQESLLKLYNNIGQIIFKKEIPIGKTEIMIEMNGIYFMVLESDGKIFGNKTIVKH